MERHPERLKRAYLYISRNEHALTEKIGEIKKYMTGGRKTDIKVFNTSDPDSLEEFNVFVSSPSLFSEQKAALLEHIEKAPTGFQKNAAERLSEGGGADTVFIFTSPSEKINKTLLEAVRETGVVRNIKPPAAKELLNWLDQKAESDGIRFTEDARFLLVENVNLDMELLRSQYSKLLDYISSESNKTIDRDAVKFLVSRVYSLKVFDLVDFLGERDKNRSLKAVNDILNEDKNLLGLITLIHRMFKCMLYLKTDGGKGSVTDYLSRNINMPPYFIGKMVNKYIKFSKNYSTAEITEIINILNGYDIGLRRSIIDNGKLMKTMIARITAMRVPD